MTDYRVEYRKDDFDIIAAVPRGLNVVKNFIRRESAIYRLIQMEEDLYNQHATQEQASSTNGKNSVMAKKSLCDSKKADGTVENYDTCANLCRPKTSITIEEMVPPRKSNPAYKNAVWLDEETVVGRAFPVKFRIRLKQGTCSDCGKGRHLFSTPTENTNVVLLANCCDVMVWPSQKVEQMNNVPVTLISGNANLTEYVLDEQTVL